MRQVDVCNDAIAYAFVPVYRYKSPNDTPTSVILSYIDCVFRETMCTCIPRASMPKNAATRSAATKNARWPAAGAEIF